MAGSKEIISIEELHQRRKIVRKEVTTASEAADNPSIVVQVEETSGLTRSMEERFKSMMDADNQSQTPDARIRRVPIMLRDIKDVEKYFVPRVVSIGPYHHGNVKYQQAEMLKIKFAKEFNNGDKEQMKCLYNAILKEIKNLRDCYEEDPTKNYDDEALAWMLFVDGCSVLHYIYCHKKNMLNKWSLKDHHAAFVHQDLFLLENQLPFRVLELLMSISKKVESKNGISMDMIEEFIKMNIETPDQKLPEFPEDSKQKPSHLLDLLRMRLVGPCHKYGKADQQEDQENDRWHSFRNVMELKEAGIYLKPSQTNCLGDVSFGRYASFGGRYASFNPFYYIFGHLKLPPILIDDSTKPKFLNLIAYEMSPGTASNLEVTSYICFLDSLIDHAHDVKNLRTAGIVHNILGSDEEVARLFNDIGTDLVPNRVIYSYVRSQIQKHYKNRVKSWMAQVIHDHFRSPWTIIAFTGAIFAILLSAIQAVFAVRGPLAGQCNNLCNNITKGADKS